MSRLNSSLTLRENLGKWIYKNKWFYFSKWMHKVEINSTHTTKQHSHHTSNKINHKVDNQKANYIAIISNQHKFKAISLKKINTTSECYQRPERKPNINSK